MPPCIRQGQATNELATCCTPCFPPPAQVSILPHQLSEECPRSSARHRASLSLVCGVAQEVGARRRREQATLASTKRSPRWPCLGGETDGAVPLKALHQPATLPTPSSTAPYPHTYGELFMCPAKSDKRPFEVQVRRMMLAFSM